VSNTLSKCHNTIPRRASGLVQIAISLIGNRLHDTDLLSSVVKREAEQVLGLHS
jgi:hypothetical protein